MDTKELKEVLSLHALWLNKDPKGKQANLGGVDLSYAHLEGANLECANLEGANLECANLECAYLIGAYLKGAYLIGAYLKGANLKGAYLKGANLKGAYLSGVNLSGANMQNADLSYANLYRANLEGADLKGANLEGANLECANLECADLSYANLYRANLEGANLSGSVLPHFQICPQEGSFVAYKKTTRGVIKLLIPEDAKRTNSLVGRKCRASKVVVLGGKGVGGTGTHYEGIIYGEGKTIECVDYNGDIRVECTRGIHFFMTETEAQEWS